MTDNAKPELGHNQPPDDTPIRCFQRYDHNQRAALLASHRQGHRARERVGEFFWVVPSMPGIAFPNRKRALKAVAERDSW